MGKLIDLTGQRFGHWTVLSLDSDVQKKNRYWKCKCDCGTFRSVAGTSLRSGISVSCGCEKDKKTSVRTRQNVEDMSGQRFGKWTVIRQDLSNNHSTKYGGARWICKCDCGTERSVFGYALRRGKTTSCGCQNADKNIIDLTGHRYGNLVVLRRDEAIYNDHKGARWICKCDCGNEISVLSGRLRVGQTKSCGCRVHNNTSRHKLDLVGNTYGKWTVLYEDKSKNNKKRAYICRCACGTIRSVDAYALSSGYSKSCGCGRTLSNEEITGNKFGKLTVIGVDTDKYGEGVHLKCLCECGTVKSYRRNHLLSGRVKSCGCENRRLSSERQFKDMTGKRFGRLVALEADHKETDSCGNSEIYWKCQCDCGTAVVVRGSSLRSGFTKSCGCLQKEASAQRAQNRTIDLIGKRFGYLTVKERVSISDDNRFTKWKCVCDCGNEKLADGYYLKKGMISSCGCLKQSKYELFVLQYFEEKGYTSPEDYEYQKRFDDLRGFGNKPLSYDFAVYRDGVLFTLIECQGQQHYKAVDMFGGDEQFAKQQLHDEAKLQYSQKLGVPLIEIPYTVVNYDEVKTILLSADI